jgi:hypothetical protein
MTCSALSLSMALGTWSQHWSDIQVSAACQASNGHLRSWNAETYLAPSSANFSAALLYHNVLTTRRLRGVSILCSTDTVCETDHLIIATVASRAIRHRWHNRRQAKRRTETCPNLPFSFCCSASLAVDESCGRRIVSWTNGQIDPVPLTDSPPPCIELRIQFRSEKVCSSVAERHVWQPAVERES